MKVVFSFQIIILVLFLTTFVCAKDIWLELNTPDFQIAGNADEKIIQETAIKLENFHENFQRTFTKFQFHTPFPSKVIVFNKNSKYPNPNKNFFFAEDANYITIPLEKDPNEVYSEIYYNYAHFLINNNLGEGKIPAWLNQGLAEYFANLSNTLNLLASQQSNLSTLENLLNTDNFTLQNQGADRKALFNAQSFAFLSFLLNEKGAGKFTVIEQFIEFLQNGKDVRDALILTFRVDINNLEIEFSKFLQKPNLAVFNNAPVQKIEKDFQVSPLSEAKSLAVLGDFLYYSNRLDEATEILEKSLKLEPKLSLAFSTMALIKAKEFYYEEAETLAEKSIEIEPENFLNYFRYAVALSKVGMTEYGFVSGYHPVLAEQMRKALNKSIELNPHFTEAYALLTFVNYVRNEQLADSLIVIKKALAIAPQNQRYLLRLAEINLRKENFIEARKIALNVFRTASTESLKLYAQNTVQRIDSTEYQLSRIRNEKTKYVNDDLVTDKPLSDEEIKRLREKATADQIRGVLRRPQMEEKRILASLTRIECGKEKIDFVFKTQNGSLRLQSRNFDGVGLISFIEELSDFRLNCGNVNKENYASVIFGNGQSSDSLISIEFVPKGFKL